MFHTVFWRDCGTPANRTCISFIFCCIIAFDTEPNKGKQSDCFGSELLGWDWDWRLHPSPDMNYTWNETPVQHWIYELGAQFWWLFHIRVMDGHGIFVAMIASGGHPSTPDGMKNLHQTAGHRSDRKMIHSNRKTWEKTQTGAVEVRNGQIYGYKLLVVWNMFYDFPYILNNNPNCYSLHHFSEG